MSNLKINSIASFHFILKAKESTIALEFSKHCFNLAKSR